MSAPAKMTTRQLAGKIGEYGVKIVKSDTGRYYLTYPGKPGTGRVVSEFKQDSAVTKVFRLLVDKDEPVSSGDVSEALSYLRADDDEDCGVAVHNRVAYHDGRIYLDLGDPKRQVVEIKSGGWNLTTECPVLFHRPKTLMPLPEPVRGGNVDVLKETLGFDGDRWWLLLGVVLATFNARGPHLLTVVQGPSGAGKSLLSWLIGHLIDPRGKAQLTRIRTDLKALMVSCHNKWVVAIDNQTPLTPTLSADLCSVVTGVGIEDRQLWTDSDVCAIGACNPMVLNGVDGLLARDEIRTRAVPFALESGTEKKDEAVLKDKIKSHHPAILGSLLDYVAAGLALDGRLTDKWTTRTCTAEGWVEACYRGKGHPAGTFTAPLARVRGIVARDALRDWPPYEYVAAVAKCGAEMGAQDLHDMLTAAADDGGLPSGWPANASALGRQLSQRKSELATLGIVYTGGHSRDGTLYQFDLREPVPAGDTVSGEHSSVCPSSEPISPALLTKGVQEQAVDAIKRDPDAVVCLLRPREDPVVIGRPAKVAAELFGRPAADGGLIPLTPPELKRLREHLGNVKVAPVFV